MASEKIHELSFDDSDVSFSGFSTVSDTDSDIIQNKKTKKPKEKMKGKSQKGKSKDKPKTKLKSAVVKKDKKDPEKGIDITKLSSEDIDKLKGLLGLPKPSEELYEEDDFHIPLNERPNLTIEIDNDNLVEPIRHENLAQGMSDALFEDNDRDFYEEESWELPKLKRVEKGKPVAKSLANMINTSCTSLCDTDELLKSHKVPENCDKACPPNVNLEIWKAMDKKSQIYDKYFVDIQSLVSASMTPIMKLAELLKPQIVGNSEAKSLLSDSLTLLGQVQYNLSLRRRYAIRPVLRRKYHPLCSVAMPITSNLFGDDVGKDIKACEANQYIGKDNPYRPQVFRGASRGRFTRRPYGGQRYQPYGRGQQRGSYGYRGHYQRRMPAATATAPNERA